MGRDRLKKVKKILRNAPKQLMASPILVARPLTPPVMIVATGISAYENRKNLKRIKKLVDSV